jgi:uncharacterized membrane protein YphA (DoxX/SURF4 family)
MRVVQVIIACLGRICLGGLFIVDGINYLFDWNGTVQNLQNGLCQWAERATSFPQAITIAEGLLPMSATLVTIALILVLLGGMLVFFGVKPRFGAFLLILFLLPITVIFHSFWLVGPKEKAFETVLFMKNLAILGGLFTILAFGNGSPMGKSTEKNADER